MPLVGYFVYLLLLLFPNAQMGIKQTWESRKLDEELHFHDQSSKWDKFGQFNLHKSSFRFWARSGPESKMKTIIKRGQNEFEIINE